MITVLAFLALAHATAQHEAFHVYSMSGNLFHDVACTDRENGMTVRDIKASIAKERQIPIQYQTLVFDTEVLQDTDTIRPETHMMLTLQKMPPTKESFFQNVREGDVDGVEYCIKAGYDLEQCDEYGNTALHRAAKYGYSEVVRILVESSCDLDHADDHGYTALMWASHHGHTDIVNLLVESSCDLDRAENNGYTALMFASQEGHSDIVNLLVENSCDLDHADDHGYTALMSAAASGKSEVVRILVESSCDLNHANKNGDTALILAAASFSVRRVVAGGSGSEANVSGKSEVVRILVENSCDLDHANNDGDTALILAASKGFREATGILLQAGCDYKHVNRNNETALSLAYDGGHAGIVMQIMMRKQPFARF